MTHCTSHTSLQETVPFSIGQDSGMLTVSGALDYDEPPTFYQFPIFATVSTLRAFTKPKVREADLLSMLRTPPYSLLL